MAVIARVVIRGVTKEQYDAVRDKVGWLEDVPAGGVAHLTWWDGDDCHNIDAWESADAFNEFGESRLGPGMAAVGITTAPEITFYDAHEIFVPAATVIRVT